MDTPNKLADERNEGSVTRTPFRERALVEQRWREELLLSATPGLKRNAQVNRPFGRVRSDPDDLKMYLRDLSSVLVSQQKKNLTSYLVEANTSPQGHERHVQPEDAHSLSKLVFSQLQNTDFRSKARKVDPISIKEGELHSAIERSSSPANITEHTVDEISLQDFGDQDVILSPPTLGIDAAVSLKDGGSSQAVTPDSDFDFDSDSDSDSDSGSVMIEPLPMGQLKKSLRPFMALNNITLNKDSWRVIRNASDTLLQRLSEGLTDENNRMVPDRQSILKVFERYEITPKHTTNDDLFEMCGKYLPLEDLNALEMSLFL